MFDATGLAIPLFVCGNGLDIDTGEKILSELVKIVLWKIRKK